jgi:hypothetical protein
VFDSVYSGFRMNWVGNGVVAYIFGVLLAWGYEGFLAGGLFMHCIFRCDG